MLLIPEKAQSLKKPAIPEIDFRMLEVSNTGEICVDCGVYPGQYHGPLCPVVTEIIEGD